jgi:hypothetical protein
MLKDGLSPHEVHKSTLIDVNHGAGSISVGLGQGILNTIIAIIIIITNWT